MAMYPKEFNLKYNDIISKMIGQKIINIYEYKCDYYSYLNEDDSYYDADLDYYDDEIFTEFVLEFDKFCVIIIINYDRVHLEISNKSILNVKEVIEDTDEYYIEKTLEKIDFNEDNLNYDIKKIKSEIIDYIKPYTDQYGVEGIILFCGDSNICIENGILACIESINEKMFTMKRCGGNDIKIGDYFRKTYYPLYTKDDDYYTSLGILFGRERLGFSNNRIANRHEVAIISVEYSAIGCGSVERLYYLWNTVCGINPQCDKCPINDGCKYFNNKEKD